MTADKRGIRRCSGLVRGRSSSYPFEDEEARIDAPHTGTNEGANSASALDKISPLWIKKSESRLPHIFTHSSSHNCSEIGSYSRQRQSGVQICRPVEKASRREGTSAPISQKDQNWRTSAEKISKKFTSDVNFQRVDALLHLRRMVVILIYLRLERIDENDHFYPVLISVSGGEMLITCVRRPILEADSARLVRERCTGLPRNGIVHGDIKPENLMLSSMKRLRLCHQNCRF
jgi:hypothetical protein